MPSLPLQVCGQGNGVEGDGVVPYQSAILAVSIEPPRQLKLDGLLDLLLEGKMLQ